jgi:hypothetical protein
MLVSRFQFIPILLSRSFEFLFQVFNFCGNFGQYLVALIDIPFFFLRSRRCPACSLFELEFGLQ